MPFPIVWGIPKETPKETLIALRKDIVSTLAKAMPVSPAWVRPFFSADLLDEPTQEDEGCNTIYACLDTAMFFGKENAEPLAKGVTSALATTIWGAFNGKYEVEVFVGNLNPAWKTLLKAAEPDPDFEIHSVEETSPGGDFTIHSMDAQG